MPSRRRSNIRRKLCPAGRRVGRVRRDDRLDRGFVRVRVDLERGAVGVRQGGQTVVACRVDEPAVETAESVEHL